MGNKCLNNDFITYQSQTVYNTGPNYLDNDN